MYVHPDLDSQLVRQSSEDVLREGASAPRRPKSRLGRMIGQIKQTWTELDYAQHRLIEIQLGVPMVRDAETDSRATTAALEAMYARPSHR